MDNLRAIRELIAPGESGKALATLIEYLEKDARFKDNFLRTLRVLEGEYNAVRQKELKGIIPFAEAQREYNRINDALLAILDDLEAGRIPAEAVRSRGRNFFLVLIGVLVLALAVFALIQVFGNKKPVCPEFTDAAALPVLIIPFDPLGAQSAPVELRIQESISTLTGKAGIPVEVRIAGRRENDRSALNIAESRGKTCKAALVIYGQYLAFSADSIRVKLGFINLKPGGKAGTLPFSTFRDITEVAAPRDLQDALFAVCTMIAINEEKWDFAQRWMEKIKDKDAAEVQMAQWVAEKRSGGAAPR
ncbi:MAG: hypothetical protein R3D58_23320 [Saprospiraceae bacterium]|jgi:hypothetical protein|nr:hypothetical protein [Lewinellaceae bacterium]